MRPSNQKEKPSPIDLGIYIQPLQTLINFTPLLSLPSVPPGRHQRPTSSLPIRRTTLLLPYSQLSPASHAPSAPRPQRQRSAPSLPSRACDESSRGARGRSTGRLRNQAVTTRCRRGAWTGGRGAAARCLHGSRGPLASPVWSPPPPPTPAFSCWIGALHRSLLLPGILRRRLCCRRGLRSAGSGEGATAAVFFHDFFLLFRCYNGWLV